MQSAPFLQKMIRWNASKNHPTRAFKNQYFYWSVVFFTHMHCIRNELQFNLKFCLHNSDIVWGITTDTFIVLQNRHPPSPSCWSAWFFVWLCIFFCTIHCYYSEQMKTKTRVLQADRYVRYASVEPDACCVWVRVTDVCWVFSCIWVH